MGGVKSEQTKQQWESLSEPSRLDYILHWITVEVDGRRVKGIVLSKATVDKMTNEDTTKLEKRGYTVYLKTPEKPLTITDDDLYESGKGEKTVQVQIVTERMMRQKKLLETCKLPSVYIKKEDYDSLTPEQRAKQYKGSLYYFKDTTTLIPESQAIIDVQLDAIRKVEESLANQPRIISLNDWILSLY